MRVRNSQVCHVKVHKGEVSGLKWSAAGSMLASGANDTRVYLWNACKMSPNHHVYRFNHHCANGGIYLAYTMNCLRKGFSCLEELRNEFEVQGKLKEAEFVANSIIATILILL